MGGNSQYSGIRLSRITRPSTTIHVMDGSNTANYGRIWQAIYPNRAGFWHFEGHNILFVDGHVGYKKNVDGLNWLP